MGLGHVADYFRLTFVGILVRHRRDIGRHSQRETTVGVSDVRRRRQRLHRSAGNKQSQRARAQ